MFLANKAKAPYHVLCTGLVRNPYCAEMLKFLEVPYYKTVREMVKLLSKALARRHFLIKEGVPYREDLMRPKIFRYAGSKCKHVHLAMAMRCLFSPTQYRCMVSRVPQY